MASEMTLKAAMSPPTTMNAISRLAATVLRANQSIIGVSRRGRARCSLTLRRRQRRGVQAAESRRARDDILRVSDILGGSMLVSRWGNSLAVRLPRALVERLGLRTGDELEVVAATAERIAVAKDPRRAEAVERMRARALSLPDTYVFDRDETNAR